MASLMQVKQQPNESLSQYVKRFREAVRTITDLNAPQALEFFTTGLDVKLKKLMKDIIFNPPKDMLEAYDRAENFITIEEAMGNLKSQTHVLDKKKDRDKNGNPRPDMQPNRGFSSRGSGGGQPPFPNRSINKIHTPLSKDRARILEEIKDKLFFEPCPTNSHLMRGDPNQYCNYHQNIGHSTEDCRQLKKLIEKNVQNGELVHYVIGREGSGRRHEVAYREQQRDQQPGQGQHARRGVDVIMGGSIGRVTGKKRQGALDSVLQVSKQPIWNERPYPGMVISFTDEDYPLEYRMKGPW